MRPNEELRLRATFLLDQLEARIEEECLRRERRRRRLNRLTLGLLPRR
jgi:hypothetical protein